MAKYNADH